MRNKILLLPIAVFILGVIVLDIVPAEDAHISYRYAENLAEGRGFVFNAGEYIESATSTLWALALAGVHWLGADVPRAATMIALGLLLWLVVAHWGSWQDRLLVAASPLIVTALSGFEATAAAVALVWLVTLAGRPKSVAPHWLVGVVAAAVGLLRPEGWAVAAAVLVAGTELQQLNRDDRGRLYRYGVFALVLGLQLAFRYVYFGDLLPATFYAKSGGSFRSDGLMNTAMYYGPLLLALVPAWIMRRDDGRLPDVTPRWRRHWPVILVILLVFPLAYLFMHQSQNIGLRFQYWLLPATLIAAGRSLLLNQNWYRYTAVAAAVLMMAMTWTGQTYRYDDRKAVGERLAGYRAPEPLTMAVTEAGWLPYYSGWRTYDLVGLIDSTHAAMDTARLTRIGPDMVMFHGYGVDSTSVGGYPEWARIIDPVYAWCKRHDYLLVAIYGTPWDNRWYWLRGQPPLSLIIDIATASTQYVTRINPSKACTVAQGAP